MQDPYLLQFTKCPAAHMGDLLCGCYTSNFCFLDWVQFWGIRKIGHEGTSRWAILPPSDESKKSMSNIYTNISSLGERTKTYVNPLDNSRASHAGI